MKNKKLWIIPLLFSFISLASCSSNPTSQVNNTKVTLVADDYEMIPGQHTKIRAQAINFSSSLLEITSSDERIVSVSSQDEIIAHQEGTAIITASKKMIKKFLFLWKLLCMIRKMKILPIMILIIIMEEENH